jgi:hypothetical protein
MKNFKYSIFKDFVLVNRQSDGTAIKGGCYPMKALGRVLVL